MTLPTGRERTGRSGPHSHANNNDAGFRGTSRIRNTPLLGPCRRVVLAGEDVSYVANNKDGRGGGCTRLRPMPDALSRQP